MPGGDDDDGRTAQDGKYRCGSGLGTTDSDAGREERTEASIDQEHAGLSPSPGDGQKHRQQKYWRPGEDRARRGGVFVYDGGKSCRVLVAAS